MMLVQTTVVAVAPYFERFLARFPTLEALAAADESEVLKVWEGLGYYRRARQLHEAARQVVARHGGRIPNDRDALLALPGVGRYIAGAVVSFAFDQPAPIVEANSQRVLARWLAWDGELAASATQARLWQAAERLVPPKGAGLFNQALMELGALICTPRTPSCLFCPVAEACRAKLLGVQDRLPVVSARPKPLAVVEACALVGNKGRLLIVKRAQGRLWEGFWEFPTIHISGADPAGRAFAGRERVNLDEGVRLLTGVEVDVGAKVQTVTFGVTRHRVRLDAFEATARTEPLSPGPGLVEARWVRPESLTDYVFGSAGRRLIAGLGRPRSED
jgi:A/G-specific adenine glycosylase